MKRLAARRRFVILLVSACVIPAAQVYACAPGAGGDEPWQHAQRQSTPLAMLPPASAPACCETVPDGVIGVNRGSVLDRLSSGGVVLVKWPDGSRHDRWTARSRRDRMPGDSAPGGAHVFFLWPDS
ncbi:hypothetical protein BTH42_07105 [Burkholderia sp. SRS-W-2-2016]|uniref:hypothetical protein n=1 Tax=Burkholderia sp. SRS-W-2-2016 TaxID=1926878 RepID=UPI00094AF6C4|nr:hypothetical protein [Burkholderia sp. SRS-W-2-2016]OLL32214.1 hypothetical protein BTH42_07105 [Burkholderia sp. SRS-W-2-2016]